MRIRKWKGRWIAQFKKADGTLGTHHIRGATNKAEAEKLMESLSAAELEQAAHLRLNTQRLLPRLLNVLESVPDLDALIDAFSADHPIEAPWAVPVVREFDRFLIQRRKDGPKRRLTESSFSADDVRRFLAEKRLPGSVQGKLAGPPLSEAMIRLRFRAMVLFCSWLQSSGRRADHAAAGIEPPAPAAPALPPPCPTISRLRHLCQHPDPAVRAVVRWGWELGLTLPELAALRWQDQTKSNELVWPDDSRSPLPVRAEVFAEIMRLPRTSKLIFPELHESCIGDPLGIIRQELNWSDASDPILLAHLRQRPGGTWAPDFAELLDYRLATNL